MVAVESNGHRLHDDVSELVEAYRSHTPPVAMGRRFLAFRSQHGISMGVLARFTGITAGTVHHYESLVRNLAPELIEAVEAGKLTFKEARSLADLPSHARQIEIAQPFVDGFLSSVYVEAAVRHAKAMPKATCEKVVDAVVAHTKVKPRQWTAPRKPVSPVLADASEVTKRMLDLAALLTPVASTPYPEIVTMRLRQTARILIDRLQAAKLAGPAE